MVIKIITVSAWCIPVLLFFALSGQLSLCIIAYATALCHELGHILSAAILRYKIGGIRILPVGICADIEKKLCDSPKHTIIVSACGPLINLIAIAVCTFVSFYFCVDAKLLTVVNLYMLLINLLPALPLDGGRILNACLALELKKSKADRISRRVSALVTIAVLLLGSILLLNTGFNFSLLTAAFFLAENLGYARKNTGISRLISDEYVRTGKVEAYMLSSNMTVIEASREIDKNDACLVCIADSAGNIVSVTTNKCIFEAMSDGRYYEKIDSLTHGKEKK